MCRYSRDPFRGCRCYSRRDDRHGVPAAHQVAARAVLGGEAAVHKGPGPDGDILGHGDFPLIHRRARRGCAAIGGVADGGTGAGDGHLAAPLQIPAGDGKHRRGRGALQAGGGVGRAGGGLIEIVHLRVGVRHPAAGLGVVQAAGLHIVHHPAVRREEIEMLPVPAQAHGDENLLGAGIVAIRVAAENELVFPRRQLDVGKGFVCGGILLFRKPVAVQAYRLVCGVM